MGFGGRAATSARHRRLRPRRLLDRSRRGAPRRRPLGRPEESRSRRPLPGCPYRRRERGRRADADLGRRWSARWRHPHRLCLPEAPAGRVCSAAPEGRWAAPVGGAGSTGRTPRDRLRGPGLPGWWPGPVPRRAVRRRCAWAAACGCGGTCRAAPGPGRSPPRPSRCRGQLVLFGVFLPHVRGPRGMQQVPQPEVTGHPGACRVVVQPHPPGAVGIEAALPLVAVAGHFGAATQQDLTVVGGVWHDRLIHPVIDHEAVLAGVTHRTSRKKQLAAGEKGTGR